MIHRRGFLLLPLATTAVAKTHAMVPANYTRVQLPTSGSEHHDVYVTGDEHAPAIVILHEIPGLTPKALDFGIRLAREGYRCYLPLIFGSPNTYSLYANTIRACFGGQIACSAAKGESHCINWLRPLCDEIATLSPRGRIGVIGMCLTGTLPLALLREQGPVHAAVLSQPALPTGTFAKKSALGVSDADIENARKSRVPILGLRFTTDTICPPERFDTLAELFPGQFSSYVIPPQPGEPARAAHMKHAVLTESYDPEMPAVRMAYEKVVTLMRDTLAAS